MLLGAILLVTGAVPWAYWISRMVEGGRGAVAGSGLTALAGICMLLGLLLGFVGLVQFMVSRGR